MECLRCSKKIPVQLRFTTTALRYCKNCFISIIEKRLRKYFRHYMLKKKNRVVVKDAVSRYVFENVVHVPLQILKRKIKKTDFVVSLDTADDAVVAYLGHLFFAKKYVKLSKTMLQPFRCLTDEELLLYCDYNKLDFKPQKNPLKQKLHALEQHYPGTLHALEKSMRDLEGIL